MNQPTPVTSSKLKNPLFTLGAIVKETNTQKSYVVTGLPGSNLLVETKEPAYVYREFDPSRGPTGGNIIRSQKSMEGGRFVLPG